jgi:hypothetical protein
MSEVDIPKRVVVVLLFLVILVSFLGTLTVLQLYATAPREISTSGSQGVIGIRLLPQPVRAESSRHTGDSATIAVKINKYEG